MPTYDYQCRACGAVTEVIHSMLEEGPASCDRCGGDLRRVLFPAGIIFKGPGFYRNDSRMTTSSSTTPSGAKADGGASSEGQGSSKTDAGTKPASTSTDAGATKKGEAAGS